MPMSRARATPSLTGGEAWGGVGDAWCVMRGAWCVVRIAYCVLRVACRGWKIEDGSLAEKKTEWLKILCDGGLGRGEGRSQESGQGISRQEGEARPNDSRDRRGDGGRTNQGQMIIGHRRGK